jgi:hypothetical protein
MTFLQLKGAHFITFVHNRTDEFSPGVAQVAHEIPPRNNRRYDFVLISPQYDARQAT